MSERSEKVETWKKQLVWKAVELSMRVKAAFQLECTGPVDGNVFKETYHGVSIYHLTKVHASQLLAIKGFGWQSLKELRAWMKEHGAYLKHEDPLNPPDPWKIAVGRILLSKKSKEPFLLITTRKDGSLTYVDHNMGLERGFEGALAARRRGE